MNKHENIATAKELEREVREHGCYCRSEQKLIINKKERTYPKYVCSRHLKLARVLRN